MTNGREVGMAWVMAVLLGIAIIYSVAAFIFYCIDPECWGLIGRSTSAAFAVLWLGAISYLAWRSYAE